MSKKPYNKKRPPYKSAKKPAPQVQQEELKEELLTEEGAADVTAAEAPVQEAPVQEAPVQETAVNESVQAPVEEAAPAEPVAEPVAETAPVQEPVRAAKASSAVKGGSLGDKWNRFRLTSNWRIWVSIPFIVIIIAIICFGVYAGQGGSFESGMNIGIDFKGGTIITTKLGENAVENEYDTYYGIIEGAINSEDIANRVIEYAAENELSSSLTVQVVTPNVNYTQTSGTGEDMAIVFKIDNISSAFDNEANDVTRYRNELILEKIATDINAHFSANEITSRVYVNEDITSEYIGASASSRLLMLGGIALAVAIIVILIYVMIRFEVFSGLSAVIALIHDVAIMFCITIIFRIQVNAAFVSAIITIVAYSINNTIVIFDRVRENNKIAKKMAGDSGVVNTAANLRPLVDRSVRETTLRNFNSTITTLVMILLFSIIGTSSVREFGVPVIAGLIGGFYSSMFLSPSLYILMKESNEKRKAKTAAKKALAAKEAKAAAAK